jgi:hypothetical protein
MDIYLPDLVVQALSGLLGFVLSSSIRRWISTGESVVSTFPVSIGRCISAAKSEFPCYLEELIDFQGLMGERDASTSQCRILNTSGFSNQRRYKAAQSAHGQAPVPRTRGNVSDGALHPSPHLE